LVCFGRFVLVGLFWSVCFGQFVDFLLLLQKLPKELLSMTTLQRLSVGGNSAIPTTTQKIFAAWAAKLTKLDLSRSCISALPTDISILTRLTELDLHHNELKTIPPQIADLTNLKTLDISHNPQLESLPVQLWRLTNLQKLNIEGTHPSMFADGTIKHNMDTSAILSQLKLQASTPSMQPCARLKLMLVGQENVGKTSLAKALKVRLFFIS
jgi:Leucine-rich repeat (LRR) protein